MQKLSHLAPGDTIYAAQSGFPCRQMIKSKGKPVLSLMQFFTPPEALSLKGSGKPVTLQIVNMHLPYLIVKHHDTATLISTTVWIDSRCVPLFTSPI